MEWTVAEAKAGLSDLLRRAQSEPQRVYRRRELVAVVVDATTFERLQQGEEASRVRSLAEAAAEARAVLADEGFDLDIPARRDRDAGFGEAA
jgi:prevent-host-death family protein